MKVGVLGLGKMGMLHFMNTLHQSDVKVVAVADKSCSRLEKAKRLNNHVNVYDDYERLMDSEVLDAVIISLPNFIKEKSISYASEKGLHIFVDKPLARNFSEAKKIVKKVKVHGVRLMVGVNYRYIDSVQKLRKGLDEGQIGDVIIATSELIMNGPFSHPLLPQPVPEWWLSKERAGGGALLDLSYHLIDIYNWLFGDLRVLYSTFGHKFNLSIEDNATVILESKKTGTRCVIDTGWFSRIIFPHFNFRVNLHGTNGYLSTDQFAPRNLYLHSVKEAALNFFKRITGREINLLSYTFYYASFAKILHLFFESIKSDSPLPISLEGQLEVMRTIEEIYNKNETAPND